MRNLVQYLVLVATILSGLSPHAETRRARFVEMRDHSTIDYQNVSGDPSKRLILSSLGNGIALLDFDQDGDLDLFLTNGARLDDDVISEGPGSRLYRNEGDFAFDDVTLAAGGGGGGWAFGSAAGDVDNDGFPDLFVTRFGADLLYRNRGDGTFVESSWDAGITRESWSASAAFFDGDGDGFLDLYVTSYLSVDPRTLKPPGAGPNCLWLELEVFCGPAGLTPEPDAYYRNNGDFTFTDVTRSSFPAGLASPSLGVVAGDYDDDGDVDLYVVNDSQPNFLFQNDGDGRFDEVALLSGAAYNMDGLAQAGMGVDMGDLNGDGVFDLFVTNFSHDANTAYFGTGKGLFSDETRGARLRGASWFELGWATRIVDLDNDGDEDLFVANGHVYPQVDNADAPPSYGQRNQIFWNDGEGRFEEGAFEAGDAIAEERSSRGGAFGDLDDDGDIDIVVLDIDAPPSLLRNELPASNWLVLRLVGRSTNRDGVGVRVVVSAGHQVKEVHPSGSYLSSNDPRLHFGLGPATRVASIEILWPSGQRETLTDVPAGSVMLVMEEPL